METHGCTELRALRQIPACDDVQKPVKLSFGSVISRADCLRQYNLRSYIGGQEEGCYQEPKRESG